MRRVSRVALFLGALLPVVGWTMRADAATLRVNSLADNTTPGNGLVTLREAVAAANSDTATDLGDVGSGADTIVFEASLAGGTIELALTGDGGFGPSALAVTSDVTISAAAAPSLTISRSGAVARLRLFFVAVSGRLRLEDVTLANGLAAGFDGGQTHRGGTGGGGGGLGGAVFNQGSLELARCTLASNQASGGRGGPESQIFDTFPRGGSGGGGLAGAGGNPTGSTAAFDIGGVGGAGGGGAGGNGCEAPGGLTAGSPGDFGGGGGGGAGCANDPASSGAPGGFAGGGAGGGGGQTGQPAGAGAPGGFGGGDGGNGTSSSSGSAPGGGGGGGAGLGGAVFNHGGSVTVVNSTFSANVAQGGAGGRNGAPGHGLGGAIFNHNGTLSVLASTFSGNAAESGGGIYNLGEGEGTASAVVDGSILADSVGGNDFHNGTSGGGTASATGGDDLMESESGFGGSVVSSADPQLGALGDNDGPTPTHLPALTSPVIDASSLVAPAIDQRGVTRPQGAAHDIGAVEVVLNQPPVAVCQNVTVPADSSCLGHATANDVDGGSFDPDGDPITLSLSPAGPFALGDTPVQLTVTDDGALSDSCQATVTVVDTTPPAIACPPNAVLQCPSDTSPASTGSATATDNCSTPAVAYADASAPGCGGTVTITRTWTATDPAGNSAACVQTVQTIDTVPPTVVPGPNNQVCLWPPNHKMVFIPAVTATVQIVDACDPHPVAAQVACASNQCDDAPCAAHPGENGDGNTVGDCAYTPATDRLAMRSERAGTDPGGRTYSLSVAAVDGCGNQGAPVVTFTGYVPHDQSPQMSCLRP